MSKRVSCRLKPPSSGNVPGTGTPPERKSCTFTLNVHLGGRSAGEVPVWRRKPALHSDRVPVTCRVPALHRNSRCPERVPTTARVPVECRYPARYRNSARVECRFAAPNRHFTGTCVRYGAVRQPDRSRFHTRLYSQLMTHCEYTTQCEISSDLVDEPRHIVHRCR